MKLLAVAAVLAAALCLLLGVWMGRDARQPAYFHNTGFRDDERVDSV
jgi:hypothetical protein